MELLPIKIRLFSLLVSSIIFSGHLVSSLDGTSSPGDRKCTDSDKGRHVRRSTTFLGNTFEAELTMFCNKNQQVEVESCKRKYTSDNGVESAKEETFELYYPGEAYRYKITGKQAYIRCNAHELPSLVIWTGLRCQDEDTIVSNTNKVEVNGVEIKVKHECELLPKTPSKSNGVKAKNNRFWQVVECSYQPPQGAEKKWPPGRTEVINDKEVLCSSLLPPSVLATSGKPDTAIARPVAAPSTWKGATFETQDERINRFAAELKAAKGNYFMW